MIAEKLSIKEQDEFTEEFYFLWDKANLGEHDSAVDCPWGCPWYNAGLTILTGKDIPEMAKNYFDLIEDEVRETASEVRMLKRELASEIASEERMRERERD